MNVTSAYWGSIGYNSSLYPFIIALSNHWVSSAQVIGPRQTLTYRERLDESSDQVGFSRTASVSIRDQIKSEL